MRLRHRVPYIAWILISASFGGCDDPDEGFEPAQVNALLVRQSVCLGNDMTTFDLIGTALFRAYGIGPEDVPVDIQGFLQCAEATDCPSFLSCIGVNVTASCDPTAFTETCSGDRVQECTRFDDDTAWIREYSCASDSHGNTSCIDGQCATGVCTQSERRCNGDVALNCDDGRLVQVDCGRIGGVCVVDETGEPECVQSQESCSADRCDGDRAIGCGSVGSSVLDCNQIESGLTCVQEEGDVFCAILPAEAECDIHEVACNGNTARLCPFGRWVDIDCATFENATCETRERRFFGPAVGCVAESWNP